MECHLMKLQGLIFIVVNLKDVWIGDMVQWGLG